MGSEKKQKLADHPNGGSPQQGMLCACAGEVDEMQGRGRAHSQSAMSKVDDAADRRIPKQVPAFLIEDYPNGGDDLNSRSSFVTGCLN